MIKYQLEICNPVSGEWVPHGTPARTMTAAHLWGLRLYPDRDLRVVPVEVDDASIPPGTFSEAGKTIRVKAKGTLGNATIRRISIDGQSVIATSGVSDDMIRDEIARRRAREMEE